MLTYHQCGHNFVWNLQSLMEDDVGEGLILSPVNIPAGKIETRIPQEVLGLSWMDPQFYLPHDSKNNLETYSFFPGNLLDQFTTSDFESYSQEAAEGCLSFQNELGLQYAVIPTRYFEDLPSEYLEQLENLFVQPFLEAREQHAPNLPLLLTVIAKRVHLDFGSMRDEILSWATSFPEVEGVYLLFDHNFQSKQIKDPAFLAGALRFIRALRQNGMKVHVGYSGIEGLLYSVADPTSVSVGSYENLRSFGIRRLESQDNRTLRSPRPRIYSGLLLQWIEDTFLPPISQLVSEWQAYFDDSPYKEYLLTAGSSLNSQRPEVYKHYFHVFDNQVDALPVPALRADHLRSLAIAAMEKFEEIQNSGVVLDPNSDGSHLPAWMNSLAMFEAQPE